MSFFGIECIGYAALVVRIPSLNIHWTYLLQKVSLFVIHLLVETTYFSQSPMFVYIWWYIVVRSSPIGF